MTVANVRIEEFLERGNQITEAVAASQNMRPVSPQVRAPAEYKECDFDDY